MDIKEYIESGILEAYVLGALPPEDVAEVEANIARYPELAAELEAIERTMQRFDASNALNPPDHLKEKIWDAIVQSGARSANSGGSDGTPKGKVIPLDPPPVAARRQAEWRYAAAIVALVGSVALNVIFWKQGKEAKEQVAAVTNSMDTLQQKQKQLALQLDSYNKERNMMADTAMQTVVMHTIQPGHPMAATVYWSKKEGVAYVSIDALPAPPAGMQYQLWVMQDGKPVDMGVISNELASTPGMQRVPKIVTSGSAFAISLEKAGGSPTPTMQNIYVMGAAS